MRSSLLSGLPDGKGKARGHLHLVLLGHCVSGLLLAPGCPHSQVDCKGFCSGDTWGAGTGLDLPNEQGWPGVGIFVPPGDGTKEP